MKKSDFSLIILSVAALLTVVLGVNNELHVAILVPVSETNSAGVRGIKPGSFQDDVLKFALALSAVDQVNTRSPLIVPNLQNLRCDVNLTFDFVDTEFNLATTLQQYFYLKQVLGDKGVVPSVIIGPRRSSSTVPLSFISNVDRIPIIGYSATSVELDDKSSHPFFFRTVPSDFLVAFSIASLLSSYGYENAALLYIEDSYGRNYKDKLFESCRGLGITLSLHPFQSSSQSKTSALKSVESTRLNVIIAVAFTEDLETMLPEAHDMGLTGNGKMWIFSDAAGTQVSLENAGNKDIRMAKALNGTLQILATALRPETGPTASELQEKLSTLNRLVPEIQSRLPGNINSVDYPNSELLLAGKEPFVVPNLSPTYFSEVVLDDFSLFVFDAILATAYALEERCEEFKETDLQVPTQSPIIYSALKEEGFEFEGVTGKVKFDNVTQSRSIQTASIAAYNLIFYPVPDVDVLHANDTSLKGTAVFKLSQISRGYFDGGDITFEQSGASAEFGIIGKGKWNLAGVLFPPGDNTVQPRFTDLIPETKNIVSAPARVVMNCFATMVIIFAVFLIIFVVRKEKVPVVSVGQPVYLVLIAFGTILKTISIYFFGYSEEDMSIGLLNTYCNLPFWLLSIGTTLVNVSYIFKLYRIYAVISNARLFQKYSPNDNKFHVVFAVILIVNIAMLSIWVVKDPLEYSRLDFSPDSFGQPKESTGTCLESIDSYFFIILLSVFHVVQYVIGTFLVFLARSIPTDFQEGKWITIGFISQLQLILITAPIFIAVGQTNQGLLHLIYSLLVLIINVTTLSLIFVPKVYRVYVNDTNVAFGNQESVGSVEQRRRNESKKVSETMSSIHQASGLEEVTNRQPQESTVQKVEKRHLNTYTTDLSNVRTSLTSDPRKKSDKNRNESSKELTAPAKLSQRKYSSTVIDHRNHSITSNIPLRTSSIHSLQASKSLTIALQKPDNSEGTVLDNVNFFHHNVDRKNERKLGLSDLNALKVKSEKENKRKDVKQNTNDKNSVAGLESKSIVSRLAGSTTTL